MIITAHVCGCRPQPRLTTRHPAAGELPRAGKTKNRTLANLSRWPAERIEQLRAVLRGDKLLPAAEAVEIVARCHTATCWPRSAPRACIALDALLPRRAPQRRRDLALALIVAVCSSRGQAGDRANAGPRHCPAIRWARC